MTKKKGPTSYTDDPDAHAARYDSEFRRMEREQYYRDLSDTVERGLQTDPRLFSREEQAAALRNLADRVEKADERAGVIERSAKRMADKKARTFFGTDWTKRETPSAENEEQRRRTAEARAVQLNDKAQEVQPMRHFSTDWAARAAELRAAQPQQPDTPTRGPRMKP